MLRIIQDELYRQFTQRLDALIDLAIEQRNLPTTCNLVLDKARWVYSVVFHDFTFSNWQTTTHQVIGTLDNMHTDALLTQIEAINKVIKAYDSLHHIENKYFALLHRYQLHHFLEQNEEATETAAQMRDIIADYDLNGLKDGYQNLINGGTDHERFESFTEKHAAIYNILKNSGIEQYAYADISSEISATLKRNTKWSFLELPSFAFLTLKSEG
jgi:hypothetical protein